MNKFNKKLTISLPQQPIYTHENESPSVQEHENEMIQQEKEGLLQFRQYRDGVDSEFGDNRNEHHNPKLNFVQFQQFNAYGHNEKYKIQLESKLNKGIKNKRNVVIEVPDRDEQLNYKVDKRNNDYLNTHEQDKFKQPPAPSKGSKLSKVFVFPTTPSKKQEKIKQKQESQSMQQLKKSFERQRQQFYKQKSRLEKQILIKNGQIQMLHKLLTENLSNPNQRVGKQSANYQYTSNNDHLQAILLQKDLQINELLQKISDLNNLLTRKNEELSKKIIEINSSHSIIESLKNQIYIYQRKDQNEKLTKKFYIHAENNKQDIEELKLSKQFGTKGLENLYKRIQMVRMNRIQFDSRNKIKSDVSYSQTTKNRPKGVFDFKGKTFEANSTQNKSRYY